MAEQIKPDEAPEDGQRVMFFVPDGTGVEYMISAVFDPQKEAWITREGLVFDPSSAFAAEVVGFDP